MKPLRSCSRRSGFTLAEVAVTIVIVGIGLTLVLQGLNASQLTAAQTRNMRLARELALRTIGEISSGLWWETFTTESTGTYEAVYEDHPEFSGEIALGDETFADDEYGDETTDTWAERERIEADREAQARAERTSSEDEEEEEEEIEEAYEKVRVRVHFPRIQQLPDHLEIERWVPWDQVYQPEEDEEPSKADEADAEEGSSETGESK